MALNDLYRFVLSSTVVGEPATSVFHYQETTASELEEYEVAEAIGTQFAQGFVTAMLPQLSQSLALVSLVVNRIEPFKGQTFTWFFTSNDIGAVQSQVPTELAAVVARFKTNEAGKGGRGRWFIPGVPELHTDAGRMLTQEALNLLTAVETAFGPLLDGGTGVYNHVVNNAFIGAKPQVKNYEINPVLGTQRRRRARGKGFA